MKIETTKDFLTSMAYSIEQENIELFKKIIDSSKFKQYENPNEFYYAVLYPWEKFINGYLKSNLNANRDVEFIWRNSKYIDNHFKNLFEKYEGVVSCADKSRTIVSRLLNFYANGEKIEFDFDSKYTYHLPQKIFTRHDHIINFYEGLKSLMYGRPEKYIEALKVVLNIS